LRLGSNNPALRGTLFRYFEHPILQNACYQKTLHVMQHSLVGYPVAKKFYHPVVLNIVKVPFDVSLYDDMMKFSSDNWESAVVSPETAIEKIRPRMMIFLGTAMAEPRTMVHHLMTSVAKNLEDLELIQLISFGDAVILHTIQSQNIRGYICSNNGF
jgi:hypothetical protein